jgi:hypothetical protein
MTAGEIVLEGLDGFTGTVAEKDWPVVGGAVITLRWAHGREGFGTLRQLSVARSSGFSLQVRCGRRLSIGATPLLLRSATLGRCGISAGRMRSLHPS